MDAAAMLQVLTQQTEMLKLMAEKFQSNENTSKMDVAKVPLPSPLNIERDIAQNFEFFVKNWQNYCIATGIDKWSVEDENKKVHMLLTAIGDQALLKYNHFNLTDDDKSSCIKVIKGIRKVLSGKKNVIYERAIFNSAFQHESESFEEYLIRIQGLIETCEFNTFRDDLLRDRIVLGINNKELKIKLMTKPDLTLEKAIDICKVDEITKLRIKKLEPEQAVNIIKREKQKGMRSCKFCGNKHAFEKGQCPAYGKKCKKCNGNNHFAKVCKKRSSKYKKKSHYEKKIHELREDTDSEYSESEDEDVEKNLEVRKIIDNSLSGGNVKAEIDFLINGTTITIKCDLDTGANACVIGSKQLKKLLKTKDIELRESKHKLYGFGGNEIPVIGEISLTCKYKGIKENINFQVVDINHGPLLSASKCIKLGLVKFCNAIYKNEKEIVNKTDFPQLEKEARKILGKYNEVFKGYGEIKDSINLEIDETVTPTIQKARRIPIHLRDQLKNELEKLEKNGIIKKTEKHTDWVSNVLLVSKNNTMRICLDPIPLNKALKRPNCQFTTMDEILPELGKAKIFSTVDTKKGFWHIKLNESSSYLTTFWTPFGRYRWLRMPFGIAPAPEIFQMKMQHILQGLKGIEIMADDIVIYGCGDNDAEALQDHNKNFENLLKRLKQENIKLNPEKLKLCQKSIKFYGHILSQDGLKPDEKKIEAVRNFPEPKDKKDLQRFLGMITYLGRFIPKLSTEVRQLRNLLSNKEDWSWNKIHLDEFNRIKAKITTSNTLKYYDKGKPVTIECDASAYGLGAALYQDNHAISFASRTLTKTESNYAQIEKELLAVVFACIRFDQFIIGNRNITIKTDHRPLISIFKKPLLSTPKRLQRMLMVLQRYNPTIQFVSGKDNVVADTLSRAPMTYCNSENEEIKIYTLYSTTEEIFGNNLEKIVMEEQSKVSNDRLEEIRRTTMQDSCLQMIKQYIINGWPKTISQIPDEVKRYNQYKHELCIQQNIIYRNDRILIPFSL